jgi:transposase
MQIRRRFTDEFKKRVVEEVLSGNIKQSAAARQYSVSYNLISRWKNDYAMGRLDNEPTCPAGFEEKISQLERKIGQLTMENELLKKMARQTARTQSGISSKPIYTRLEPSNGDAK